MRKRILLWSIGAISIAVTAGVVIAAAAQKDRQQLLRDESLGPAFEKLKPLHRPKTPSAPGEWLAAYPEERVGQSVNEWRKLPGRKATAERGVVHVVPIGVFEGAQRKVLDATVDFTGRFFSLPVKVLEPVSLSTIPASVRRKNALEGHEQILAGYVLDTVLAPRRPPDSIAMLGLTTVDLYPEPSWNFVFGMASPDLGMGVWSIYRNGDPAGSEPQYRQCLRRSVATAAHEIGHLFDVYHCTAYECLMNGSNHQKEADSRPLDLCPSCLAKICSATGCDPAKRFKALLEFDRANGFAKDAAFLEKSLQAVEGAKP